MKTSDLTGAILKQDEIDPQAMLMEAHERAKVIMEASPFGTTLWDRNCSLFDCNEAYVRLLHVKDLNEFLERHYELNPEYQPDGQPSTEKITAMVQKAFDEGYSKFEWMHRNVEGDSVPCEVTMVRIPYGGDFAVAGYLRDLRESKAMTEAIERQGRLLNVANQMAGALLQPEMGNIDDELVRCLGMIGSAVGADRSSMWINSVRDGRLYCTQTYEWIENAESQINKEITIETSYDDAIPGWEAILSKGDCINSFVKDMSPAEQEQLSVQGIKSLCVTPIFVRGQFWGYMGFDHCHESRLLDEAEIDILRSCGLMIANTIVRHEMLREMQESMERERDLEIQKQTAQAANEAKSQFLATMSHEIRTPMSAIIGMTSIGMSSQTMEKKDYAFTKIDGASRHLLQVINDILDMSKIEANKLTLSPDCFVFETMLKNVVNIINLRTDERRQQFYINIDKNIPHSLIGDDHRLSQVIVNLLSNAVKFTPNEGVIRLDTRLLSEVDGLCCIQIDVTDSGIGITEEQKTRLFLSFEQAEAGTTRKFGGTGLGLSISKRIVELMDGEMWIESEPGRGSTFSFTVVLRRDSEEQKHLLSENVNWSNIRIFAVDDDPEIRAFFVDAAENMNITCKVAASGEEAIEMLSDDDNFDMYFLDWNLPGINGVELAQTINAKSGKNPVIIMFSSIDWSYIEDDAHAAGVDKFLPKPLFQSSIIDFINDSINWKKASISDEHENMTDDFSGHTILLAEDVDINREIVLTLLEPTGLSVDCAENGVQAVEMFKNDYEKYGMIFMDVQMPEMDGYEATRTIRSLSVPNANTIPIIAMTANVFKEDIEKCLASGMDGHVGKPLDMDAVTEQLRRFLHAAEQRKAE